MSFSTSHTARRATVPGRAGIFSLSIVPFLWQLIRLSRPTWTRRDLGRSIEYVLRLLPFLPWVLELKSLFSDPRLQGLLLTQPAIMDRVRRPYQDCRSTVTQRTLLLQQHYAWLLENYSPESLRTLLQGNGHLIAELHNGISLRLLYDRLFDKEGELMLALCQPGGERIATLAFVVAGDHSLRIGGLQGDKAAGSDYFKQLTKELHGLRPLALLVGAAQMLAAAWHLQSIKAVDNRHHVYRHWRYRFNRMHRIQRQYDALWEELEGQLDDGWYQLPLQHHVRAPEDAPSNKRAMYRRRQALQQDLQAQIAGYASNNER